MAKFFTRIIERVDWLRNAITVVSIAVPVHVVYYLFIRPSAERAVEAARLAGESAPRDLVVILKDWEQEFCVILTLCCAWMIVAKIRSLRSRRYMYGVDLLHKVEDNKDALSSALEDLENLEPSERDTPLANTLRASIRRYQITDDVQNTSDAVNSSVEALGMRVEADNAMIRYMIWAIPSIGFIGTVRGIGQALSEADEALAGDIASMTANLGTAFNSTFIALFASIVLMMFLHRLQHLQDKELIKIQEYCEEHLLRRISKTGKKDENNETSGPTLAPPPPR